MLEVKVWKQAVFDVLIHQTLSGGYALSNSQADMQICPQAIRMAVNDVSSLVLYISTRVFSKLRKFKNC